MEVLRPSMVANPGSSPTLARPRRLRIRLLATGGLHVKVSNGMLYHSAFLGRGIEAIAAKILLD